MRRCGGTVGDGRVFHRCLESFGTHLNNVLSTRSQEERVRGPDRVLQYASFEFRVGYGAFTASARWPILRCGLKEEKSNLPAIKNKTVRIVANLV